MRKFLDDKGIYLSLRIYFIDALGAMAFGLFASLLVGTILNTIGQQLGIPFLTDVVWPIANQAAGPAIAVAIAYALNAPNLVVFSATLVGVAGYDLGGPVGVYVATLVAVELGKLVFKTTKLDIIITPTVTALSGIAVASFIGPIIQSFMNGIGAVIILATEQQPFLMGALVSTIMGISLTLPISSAAIAMMLGLEGLAAGAATIGCSAQMIGFAVISYRDNGVDGLMSQGLGTSMLQMSNILKKPKIWIPPTLASFILGPLATVVFKMQNTPLGAGMGTSGLVGQIGTFEAMVGIQPAWQTALIILLTQFLLPGLISHIIYEIMYRTGHIEPGDLALPNQQ